MLAFKIKCLEKEETGYYHTIKKDVNAYIYALVKHFGLIHYLTQGTQRGLLNKAFTDNNNIVVHNSNIENFLPQKFSCIPDCLSIKMLIGFGELILSIYHS